MIQSIKDGKYIKVKHNDTSIEVGDMETKEDDEDK